jgi:predicted anti-sigma-YlaC factor YlaD
MDCQHLREVAFDYVNHKLSDEIVQSIEEHLCVCEDCRTYLGTILDKENLAQAQDLEVQQLPKKVPIIFIHIILGISLSLIAFLIYLYLKLQWLTVR